MPRKTKTAGPNAGRLGQSVLEFTLAMPFIIAVIMLLIGLGRVLVYRQHGQVVARYASFFQKITGKPPEQLELAQAVSIRGDEIWSVAPVPQNDSGGIVRALENVLGFLEKIPVIGKVFRNNFSTQTIQQDATLDVGALVPGASGSTVVGISALGDNLGTTKAAARLNVRAAPPHFTQARLTHAGPLVLPPPAHPGPAGLDRVVPVVRLGDDHHHAAVQADGNAVLDLVPRPCGHTCLHA